MSRSDVDALHRAGFHDEAVHEAIQIIGYFNYINRVADAVHVDLEPEMPPYPASHVPGPSSSANERAPRP